MTARNFRGTARVPAMLSALLLAAFIQSSSAQQTVYGFCGGSDVAGQKMYVSNVFSVSPTMVAAAKMAFLQYVQSQDSAVREASCGYNASQQTMSTTSETQITNMQQAFQKMGKPMNVIRTGWGYSGPAAATPTAASTPATASAGTQSVGSGMTAAGQQVKSSMQQSVTGAETAGTSVVTGTVTDVSTQAQQSIKDGVTKMFHHQKPAQPAAASTTTPAPAATLVASNTAPVAPGTAQPAPVHGAAAVPAPAGATTASAAAEAVKPTIQPEGDGKHFLMTTPGQADARELVLVAGTNNVYLEEATGDKYIVLPNGNITHIPKKNVAAN